MTPRLIDAAREEAGAAGVDNVRFEVSDVEVTDVVAGSSTWIVTARAPS